MKNYLILHYGFEKPTPEQMGAWNNWFESIADKQVEKGHLPGGREISHSGTKDLPFGKDSITGQVVVDEALATARRGRRNGSLLLSAVRRRLGALSSAPRRS